MRDNRIPYLLCVLLLALASACAWPIPRGLSARAQTPTAEPSPTAIPTSTLAPLPTDLPLTAGSTVAASPSARCVDRAALVDDVTVRDYTALNPGEGFTKVWRLQNTGTCTWTPQYALVFFGGERMQAPISVPLTGTVPPGAMVDLSAEMTAPVTPGTHQGFWRLRNANGEYFGLGASGDQSFWVRIVVRPVLTASPTATPPATASPTPAILVSAALELAAGSALDLDSGRLNPEAGADIAFGPLGSLTAGLLPQAPTVISLYSPPPDPPRPIDCLAAPLRPEPIPASLLNPGSIVCYLTGEAHPGYLVVVSSGETLSLAFTTWVP